MKKKSTSKVPKIKRGPEFGMVGAGKSGPMKSNKHKDAKELRKNKKKIIESDSEQ